MLLHNPSHQKSPRAAEKRALNTRHDAKLASPISSTTTLSPCKHLQRELRKKRWSLPGQQRRHRRDEDEQIEDGVLQEALHSPVGVGGGVASGAGGVVAQRYREEQAHTEGNAEPVHPGLQARRHTGGDAR